jgi:hypothetical protein
MLMGPARDSFKDALPAHARAPLWVLATLLVTFGLWLPAPVRVLIERAMESIRP